MENQFQEDFEKSSYLIMADKKDEFEFQFLITPPKSLISEIINDLKKDDEDDNLDINVFCSNQVDNLRLDCKKIKPEKLISNVFRRKVKNSPDKTGEFFCYK